MADFYFLRTFPVNLRRYLPAFIFHDSTMATAIDTLSWEHERQRQARIDVDKQAFVTTATWGLDDWEEFLGLTIHPVDDYETRRRIILARMQAAPTVTLDFLRNLVNLFVWNKKGEVRDYPEDYTLEILLPDAQVVSWEELEKNLRVYVPAHIGWKYCGYVTAHSDLYFGGVARSSFRARIPVNSGYDLEFDGYLVQPVAVVKSGIRTHIPAELYK